jgi:hypothetical protein
MQNGAKSKHNIRQLLYTNNKQAEKEIRKQFHSQFSQNIHRYKLNQRRKTSTIKTIKHQRKKLKKTPKDRR